MTFTKSDLAELKKAYKKAIENNKDSFVFRGQTFVTNYAKYLIEYLEK